jgi:hypothetical protein
MCAVLRKQKKEGKPIPEKPEDKIWREEFEGMTAAQHHQKLKEMGLEDEDVAEFDEKFFVHKQKKK